MDSVYSRRTYPTKGVGAHLRGGSHRSPHKTAAVAACCGKRGVVAAGGTTDRVGGAAGGGAGQWPAVHLTLPTLTLHAMVDPALAGPVHLASVLARPWRRRAARRRQDHTVTLWTAAGTPNFVPARGLVTAAADGAAGDPTRQAGAGVAALLPPALFLHHQHRGQAVFAATCSISH
jgi:hypothetical protein